MGRGHNYDFHYVQGQSNVICSQCGGQFKSNELRQQWDFFWACDTCFERRNPQDFVRGIPDTVRPAYSTGDPQGSFVPKVASQSEADRLIDGYLLDSITIG